MKTYLITYKDKSTEYVDAYGYRRDGHRFVFDIGHNATYVVSNVYDVELVG